MLWGHPVGKTRTVPIILVPCKLLADPGGTAEAGPWGNSARVKCPQSLPNNTSRYGTSPSWFQAVPGFPGRCALSQEALSLEYPTKICSEDVLQCQWAGKRGRDEPRVQGSGCGCAAPALCAGITLSVGKVQSCWAEPAW